MKNIKVENMNENPYRIFRSWYGIIEKSDRVNYNAMGLSTIKPGGRVSSRIVLLKYWDERGFVFFSSYRGRKGNQISENPSAALLFHWPEQGRQVRIEGVITRCNKEESDSYFGTRSRGHQVNAILSQQSSVVTDWEGLLIEAEKLESSGKAVNRPDSWGGYRLVPDLFEFWQEGKNRFNDRVEYISDGAKWHHRRLAP